MPIKEDVLGAVSLLQTPLGFFSELPHLPSPQIHVDGIGEIKEPITSAQADVITAVTELHGLLDITGSENALWHPAVWLDPSQFRLRNPEWPALIDKLCTQIFQELDTMTTLKAQLSELIVFRAGSVNIRHYGFNAVRSLGTLEINLPSFPLGGEVVLRHGMQEQVFKPHHDRPSFIFRLSDVSQETRPLSSGYRCVLVYDLMCSTVLGIVPAYWTFKVVQQWVSQNSASRENNFLYYVLEQDSDAQDASLRDVSLASRNEFQVLKSLAEGIPLEIFLVTLNKKVTKLDDDGHDQFLRYCEAREKSEHEASLLRGSQKVDLSVRNVRDTERRLMKHALPLNEENILQEDCFKGADGYVERFGEHPDGLLMYGIRLWH
ncbi:unnamed protein product [Clonostachys solani]|uniref:Uncharacterized protein n=1 Tax=Clonostachys solani TaxID=160281 RepID=A0A9P0ERL4_9HYPO|nr:unnamed protein product [Clonostachys solani]